MRAHMRDGHIPHAWQIEIPNRCVELWATSNVEQPIAIPRGSDGFGFEGVTFIVDRPPFLKHEVRRRRCDNLPSASLRFDGPPNSR
jgi:hypothetical protein